MRGMGLLFPRAICTTGCSMERSQSWGKGLYKREGYLYCEIDNNTIHTFALVKVFFLIESGYVSMDSLVVQASDTAILYS